MIISRHRPCHLPEEVIEEILVRLPFKSIFRFRCVCKSWFNLIKNSPSICNHLKECSDDVSFIPLCFIYKSKDLENSWFLNLFLFHADDEEEEAAAAAASDTNCLTRFRKGVRIWLDALSDGRKLDARYPLPVFYFKFPFSNRPSLKYKSGLKLVRHCNGIMCLSHPDFILLVNPLLNEVKTLSNPIDPPRLVGFGFDNIMTMDFKVVRLYFFRREAEVYNLKTNVWRKIAFPFVFLGCIKRSTFLNGVIHWCVEGSDDGVVYRWRMLTFNLATELFELIDFPLNWNHGLPLCYKKPPIGPFVLNQDTLAFVNYTSSRSTSSLGVWTMNKHEETTTWTKLYGIEIVAEPLRKPISFWKKDKLLYETESGRLVLYDLLTHRLSLVFDPSQVSPHNMGYYSEICLEVEAGVLCGSSLVSMNV